VVVNAAQEWCQHPDCFWAGRQLSPRFGTQLQAHLHPSFLQPSACHRNGLNAKTKLWLCLCIGHVHWQNQLHTWQPITLQQVVWAQHQLRKKLAWVLSILCCAPAIEHTLTILVTIRSSLAAWHKDMVSLSLNTNFARG